MSERIKVVVVDDHQVVLKGLLSWLEEAREIEVVGSFSCAIETLSALPSLQPHVVISDVRMPSMNGLELTEKIVEQFGSTIKIVLLSGFYSEEYHLSALEMGVSAFMPKDSSYQQILNAVIQSFLGNCIIPPDLSKGLKDTRLTKKEKEILNLVANGKKNDEISLLLNISRRTVEHHITKIFQKLDVDCRVSAVMQGIKQGIIEEF
ncbi:response regulator transcription factor [Halalkalibacter hemicellulosilyticus]|uniref:DNA-binding response regulator n=1 Tax=Halalkalibacter hemicellulosilyticusJCM 9152 TaxID=1236971 RepID=W4QBY7_9BACI|nr:response regulator transcription factor [Halalkalibacter hemicellulosilyticus]GAE29571.1 DNA-binding response regulator [Halalkalibacter hemicellulosilyticusJCM 9152]